MEAKLLASLFSFLSIFLAIYADAVHTLAVNVDDDDSTEFELETAIYYGDSNVNLGEPFSITCIIPVTDPINWTKDGEPITRHNLRHGRDEHSYTTAESHIEGEKHKIEAHISVRHALKVHEGKYQCNNLHTSYHILHVRSPVTSDTNDELSTLAGYETIYDLTPSSVDILYLNEATRRQAVVPPLQPDIGPLPLPTQATSQHNQRNRQNHHHHRPNSPTVEQRKLSFMNNTIKHYGDSHSDSSYEFIGGLMHPSEYMPPANELTTVPWRMTPITRHGPPPVFPTPRTTWLTPTVTSAIASVSPPLPHIPHVVQHQTPIYMHTDTKHNKHHQQQQQQQQQQQYYAGTIGSVSTPEGGTFEQPRFPLQTIQPTNQHQHSHTQQPTQTGVYFSPVTTIPRNPLHLNSQQHQIQRTHLQQPQQQNHLPNPGTATSSISNPYAATTSLVPQPMAPALSPTAGAVPIAAAAAPTITTTILQTKIATATTSTTTTTATQRNVKETGSLVPQYDDAVKKLKYYEIRMPLVLSCHDTETDAELMWEKNGTDVKRIKSLEGRYRIIPAERKFIIDKTDITDDGLYSCTNGKSRSDINVVARVVVRVPSNTGVVEGEKLSIVCTVLGTNPQLKWVIGNQTITNSTDRYVLKPDENNIENAILTIENVSLDDRGEYTCIGRNDANELTGVAEASDTSYVRVKGKLAALWPFLGICAEVLILCAIILIYEKRRNKSELEESDTDPQDQ